MELAFTGFLAGLVALSIPVILHFLRHKPTTTTPFPALQFMRATLARRAANNRLRKWLVLLLRCLCLAALVLAFCMPYLARFAKQPDKVTVVLWDGSFSMQAKPYAESLRKLCMDRLAKASPNHPVLLGVVSDRVVWSGKFSGQPEELLAVFKSRDRGEGTSSFEQALRLADSRLTAMPGDIKEIILITDRQALPWKTLQWEKQLSPGTRLRFISPQGDAFINTAITDLSLKSPFRGPESMAFFDVKLKNFSDTPLQGTLTCLLDGEVVSQNKVTLPARSERIHPLEVRGAKKSHGIEVRLDADDDLAIDNHRWLALNATPRPTICTTPIPSDQTDFLQLAFNPSPETASVNWMEWNEDLSAAQMDTADLLIVRDGFMLQSEAGMAFLDSLKRGGAAVVLWNNTPELRHLLLQFGVGCDLLPEKTTKELDFIDFDHQAFKPFLETQVSGLFNILFFDPPVLKVPDSAQHLANFKDGTPAIAEIAVEKGRLLVVASGMDREHTDWPTHATYLPFWREVLEYYRKKHDADRSLLVSATPHHIPGLQEARSMKSDEMIPIKDTALPALKSGNYLLNPNTQPYIVSINVPAGESDPAQLDKGFEWEKIMSTEPAKAGLSVEHPMEQGKSFWRTLFVIAVFAALGEMLIANRTVL